MSRAMAVESGLGRAAATVVVADEPWVAGQRDARWVENHGAALAEGRAPRWWWRAFIPSVLALLLLVGLLTYQIATGVGVWGNNHPVMWGWDIVNFVWWIGLAHAGTLISAVLLLLRQPWRAAVHRTAEAMTLFAVICAAIYPALHVGRAWWDWWLLPIPNANGLWPQFRSPLIWDFFALGTYFTVSAMLWYLGLLPDLALLRDRAATRFRRAAYGLLALGWTGANRSWHHYQKACLLLAGLATPLVLSVHSIVSLDFAVTQLPGWHSTIFPPYFVAGAVFSGFAMVLALVIPLRRWCGLDDVITARHLDAMGKVTLAAGGLVAYAYAMEAAAAWFGGNPDDRAAFLQRVGGPHAWAYWTMLVCNVALPQLLWRRTVRRNAGALFVLAVLVNVGMWLERFVIVVGSLERDFLPANWGGFRPTWVDVGTFIGTLGLFFTCLLLFLRWVPMISITEVKNLAARASSVTAPASEAEARRELHSGARLWGYRAEFPNTPALRTAVARLRADGYVRWDVILPHPAPGLDRAMGLKESPLGWPAFVGGLLGFAGGMVLVWFTNAADYPILVGGKPMFSPIAAMPVAFELTILGGALGVVLGFLRLTSLPRLHHPLLRAARRFHREGDHRAIVIEASDPRFHEAATRQMLAAQGAGRVERMEA
jgi:molybdopterin-containing oxidoreductase family membrane subunit